jgi:hypothetical protein
MPKPGVCCRAPLSSLADSKAIALFSTQKTIQNRKILDKRNFIFAYPRIKKQHTACPHAMCRPAFSLLSFVPFGAKGGFAN